jgi:hypothetical protein
MVNCGDGENCDSGKGGGGGGRGGVTGEGGSTRSEWLPYDAVPGWVKDVMHEAMCDPLNKKDPEYRQQRMQVILTVILMMLVAFSQVSWFK